MTTLAMQEVGGGRQREEGKREEPEIDRLGLAGLLLLFLLFLPQD